jgi:hypothetical protein
MGFWGYVGVGHESTDASELDQACMPNMVRCTVSAGSAVVFDTATWHCSMPNRSAHTRRCALFSFRSSQCFNGGPLAAAGDSRAAGGLGGLSESTLVRLMREGKLSPARRALLGLPLEPLAPARL